MTPQFALIMVVLKFLIGAVIGLCAVALVYRARFVRGAVFGGVVYVLASGLGGWADSHAAFMDGRRLDVAPWGENLWLRNRIAENETAICVVGSCGAALLAGRKTRTAELERST